MCKKRSEPLTAASLRKMLSLRDDNATQRAIAKEFDVDPSTVSKWFKKAQQKSLNWEKANEMDDSDLLEFFYGPRGRKPMVCHPFDVEEIAAKIGRGKKVEELHSLYCAEAAKSGTALKALKRSAFFDRIKKHRKETSPAKRSMMTQWEPKKYMQIDMCGDVIELKPDEKTGEPRHCVIMVATLPATNMTYAKALAGCGTADWNEGVVGALHYFQGIPDIILCDNDVALAAKCTIGDQKPTVDFGELCSIYEMEIEFARPGEPKDKASVESAVGRITRDVIKQIKARSLKEPSDVQRRIDTVLNTMNTTRSQYTDVSPWDDFRTREQPLLRKLSQYRSWSRWGKRIRQAIDGSGTVKVDGHFYLMPHTYSPRTIDTVITKDTEVLFIKPGSDEIVARYPHYEKGEPHPVDGFKHSKDEFRAPGELTAEAQLNREMGKFDSFGEATRKYVARFVKFRFQKPKRMVAQQLSFIYKKAQPLDPVAVEDASSHALEMNDFDKDNFVIYMTAWQKMSERKSAGTNRVEGSRFPATAPLTPPSVRFSHSAVPN